MSSWDYKMESEERSRRMDSEEHMESEERSKPSYSSSSSSYKSSSTTYSGSGRPRQSDYTAGGKLRRQCSGYSQSYRLVASSSFSACHASVHAKPLPPSTVVLRAQKRIGFALPTEPRGRRRRRGRGRGKECNNVCSHLAAD